MKKFIFNTLILFLLSVFGGGSVVAQVDFSLHLGGSMPLGSYASSQCVHEVGGSFEPTYTKFYSGQYSGK